MGFIKKKMVSSPSDILQKAMITKWIFFDQLVYMLLSGLVVALGFVFGDAFPKLFSGRVPLFGFIGLIFAGLAFVYWFVEWIRLISTELALTNGRLIGKKGFIAIEILDSQLVNVDSIRVDFTLLGRIFNFGTITIETRSNRYLYHKIAKPMAFQRAVNARFEEIKKESAERFQASRQSPPAPGQAAPGAESELSQEQCNAPYYKNKKR